MDNRDNLLLEAILEEISIIIALISNYDYDMFTSDEKTKRAVCMTLINIGEMVKLLSDNIKQKNPAIPWRSIAGLRDVTAHGYQTLRMDDIWETVNGDILALQQQIQELV